MRKIKFLKDFLNMFEFKTITDEVGNEYVVYKSNPTKTVSGVSDKTEFEALENHIHVVDHISKTEYESACLMARQMGTLLLQALKCSYPKKEFVVFASVQLNDSFIVRFHQKWEQEPLFYNIDDYTDVSNEKVYMFE